MQTIFDAYEGIDGASRNRGPKAPQTPETTYSMSVWQLTRSFGSAVATRGRRAMLDQIYASSFWRQTLGGPAPDRILFYPRNLQPRNVRTGQQIVNGWWRLPGGAVDCHDISPFSADAPNEMWLEAVHGFGWLAHLEALGSDEARAKARHATAHWLRTFSSFHPVGWRAQVTARRIISWLSHGRFLLAESDPVFRSHVLWSLARQARHLTRTAASAPEGLPRLTSAAAVTLSGLCLPDGEKRLAAGAHLLTLELGRQILADGGHISRSPEQLALALADVLSVLGAYRARDLPPPPALRNALDRMAPALRFFTMGDGRLAAFNGGTEGAGGWVAQLLAFDDAHGAPLEHASHVGFHRLAGADSVLVADAGPPPPPELSGQAHAGTLSFEFSHGPHRLIVNCGAPRLRDASWQNATRATAAHSTVTVSDTSSSQLLTKGFAHQVLGAKLLAGPKAVRSKRAADADGMSLLISHDGYANIFGVMHQRSLTLSHDGLVLRGEDTLSAPARPKGSALIGAAARFHLHPLVKAQLAADGRSVWLGIAGGTWRFTAESGSLALSESVYCGDGDDVRRTEQIILPAKIAGGEITRLQWSLKRE
jgi:uncharacterized heparinase superfamily protein